ncbi:hypothetical protein LTV02_35070 [Nocardia yamanashiensis]|uniref:hypothetical protein n=1 Tax=Nocardia yamanashiensis TaxID=209247 RepID=UPI001E52F4D5|nr:hypothetical protein [Nocardia yamanashiensis]UGT41118.1 hypothetical protein LTV02_35070 [Nocardia yamanashiensis]
MVEASEQDEFDAGELYATAAAVRSREDFGALLTASARAGRISVGAIKTQLGGTRSVYDWFTGKTLPRDARDARRLADLLGRVLARRYPDLDVADPIFDAWQRLAEQRQEDAAVRALSNRRPNAGMRSKDSRDAVPVDTPDGGYAAGGSRVDLVRRTSAASARAGRGRRLAAVAVSAVIGFAAAFAITRLAVTPDPIPKLSCAESANVDAGHGFVQFGIAYGPPGDPYPKQHTEIRIQTHESGGWIVYAYLAKPSSERDQIRLEWSDVQKPEDDQVHRCDGRAVNLVQQTTGILARGPRGEPRWFRACGTVATEFQWPGRGLTACTGWNRPDDY